MARHLSPADYEDVKIIGWLLLLIVFHVITVPVIGLILLLKMFGMI